MEQCTWIFYFISHARTQKTYWFWNEVACIFLLAEKLNFEYLKRITWNILQEMCTHNRSVFHVPQIFARSTLQMQKRTEKNVHFLQESLEERMQCLGNFLTWQRYCNQGVANLIFLYLFVEVQSSVGDSYCQLHIVLMRDYTAIFLIFFHRLIFLSYCNMQAIFNDCNWKFLG